MLQHLVIHFQFLSIIYQVFAYGLKTKENFKLFISSFKSVRGRLQEVFVVIWLGNFWYFG